MADQGNQIKPVDGYWLRIGTIAADALAENLRPDLTPNDRQSIADYLGWIMDEAYNMGIHLGQLSERVTDRPKAGHG